MTHTVEVTKMTAYEATDEYQFEQMVRELRRSDRSYPFSVKMTRKLRERNV